MYATIKGKSMNNTTVNIYACFFSHVRTLLVRNANEYMKDHIFELRRQIRIYD